MRIRRRIVRTDLLGRPLSEQVEELTEDHLGNVEETRASVAWVCETCRRPVENPQDIRGKCCQCGRGQCALCEGRCVVCSASVCIDCRAGFVEKALTVCRTCLQRLEERLARHDRLLAEKTSFERKMATYEMLLRLAQGGYQERGSFGEFANQLVRMSLMGKLSKLARQLSRREEDDERRLLP